MASVPHQLDPAHHSPSRQHTHHQSDDELRYQAKYRELKKQVKEVESENDRLLVQVMQTKHNIQRLRLERSILYEKLGTLDPNAAQPAQRQQQPMIASGSSRRDPVAHYQQVPPTHHHHPHAHAPPPPPPPPHHASQHHYASPVPPYPTSSSSSRHHHHSSRHHAHHGHHPPPQQYAPPPPPPPPPQGYAPEPPAQHAVDARAGSPAGHTRSPVYLPGHGMPHPDEREPGPHLVPIQSVRDAYPESGARGEYDPRDRERDYERQQQQQPEGEWRRRQSMQPSPPRDLPSVAAVLGDRKRKRSEEEGDSEPPAPMHAD